MSFEKKTSKVIKGPTMSIFNIKFTKDEWSKLKPKEVVEKNQNRQRVVYRMPKHVKNHFISCMWNVSTS